MGKICWKIVNGKKRKVEILASGKWKFLKGTYKAHKPRKKKQAHKKHHKSRSRSPAKKRTSTSRRSSRGWIFG